MTIAARNIVIYNFLVRKMNKSEALRTPENFILYLTDCNLATVSSMAMMKSRKKSEFERQISIAQSCIDFVKAHNLPVQIDSRAYKVLATEQQTVKEWVKEYDVNK